MSNTVEKCAGKKALATRCASTVALLRKCAGCYPYGFPDKSVFFGFELDFAPFGLGAVTWIPTSGVSVSVPDMTVTVEVCLVNSGRTGFDVHNTTTINTTAVTLTQSHGPSPLLSAAYSYPTLWCYDSSGSLSDLWTEYPWYRYIHGPTSIIVPNDFQKIYKDVPSATWTSDLNFYPITFQVGTTPSPITSGTEVGMQVAPLCVRSNNDYTSTYKTWAISLPLYDGCVFMNTVNMSSYSPNYAQRFFSSNPVVLLYTSDIHSTISAGTYTTYWRASNGTFANGIILLDGAPDPATFPEYYYMFRVTAVLAGDFVPTVPTTCSALDAPCDADKTCWYKYQCAYDPSTNLFGTVTLVDTVCDYWYNFPVTEYNWRLVSSIADSPLIFERWVYGQTCTTSGGCPTPTPPEPPSADMTSTHRYCVVEWKAECDLDGSNMTVTEVDHGCFSSVFVSQLTWGSNSMPDAWEGPYFCAGGTTKARWRRITIYQDCSVDGDCAGKTAPDVPTLPTLPSTIYAHIPAGSVDFCCTYSSGYPVPSGFANGKVTISWVAQSVAVTSGTGSVNVHIAWTGPGDPTCGTGWMGSSGSTDTTTVLTNGTLGTDNKHHVVIEVPSGYAGVCTPPANLLDVTRCGFQLGVYSDNLTLMDLE